MSKPITLSTILSTLFSGSDKVISEKLSAEEHAIFAGETQELNARLDALTEGNTQLVADLAAANVSLTTAQASVTSLTAQLTSVTTERDLFKEQHEKAASQGNKDPNEDENSRKVAKVEGYNAHAMSVFQKANA